MARHRYKKHHSRGKMTIPVAVAAPIAVQLVSTTKELMSGGAAGRNNVVAGWTGFGGDGFHPEYLVNTYGPMLIGLVIHKGANRFGLNGMLARARVPLFRI